MLVTGGARERIFIRQPPYFKIVFLRNGRAARETLGKRRGHSAFYENEDVAFTFTRFASTLG